MSLIDYTTTLLDLEYAEIENIEGKGRLFHQQIFDLLIHVLVGIPKCFRNLDGFSRRFS